MHDPLRDNNGKMFHKLLINPCWIFGFEPLWLCGEGFALAEVEEEIADVVFLKTG